MEVRKGYKQTEVGVIPEDWEIKSLSSITEISGGGTPSTTVAEYWNGQISWVSAGDVSNANGRFVRETAYHISELGLASSSTKIVPAGTTIIIARGATVGRMAQLGMAMAFNQTCYCLLSGSGLDQNYLYYSMMFSINSIRALTYGTIFGTITTNSFQEWKIPLPSLPEQHAIAAALSDVDALLNSLDALIAKKRLIKQGAMQELLTPPSAAGQAGKKRLPGFSGEWEVKKLGDLCTAITDGTHFTPTYVNQGIPFYSVENVTADDFTNTKFISRQAHNQLIKRCKPEKGDILMTRIGSLGDTKLIDWDVNASIYVSLALLKVNKQAINEKYLYSYTRSRKFIKDVELRSLIYAIPQKINMRDIGGVPILVPSLPEQTAIAEILSDMDAEISALEQKREKTRLLKQGMMQELLTGRIRLVQP